MGKTNTDVTFCHLLLLHMRVVVLLLVVLVVVVVVAAAAAVRPRSIRQHNIPQQNLLLLLISLPPNLRNLPCDGPSVIPLVMVLNSLPTLLPPPPLLLLLPPPLLLLPTHPPTSVISLAMVRNFLTIFLVSKNLIFRYRRLWARSFS